MKLLESELLEFLTLEDDLQKDEPEVYDLDPEQLDEKKQPKRKAPRGLKKLNLLRLKYLCTGCHFQLRFFDTALLGKSKINEEKWKDDARPKLFDKSKPDNQDMLSSENNRLDTCDQRKMAMEYKTVTREFSPHDFYRSQFINHILELFPNLFIPMFVYDRQGKKVFTHALQQ